MKIHSKKTKRIEIKMPQWLPLCSAIAYYTFPVAYKLVITVIPFITILQF